MRERDLQKSEKSTSPELMQRLLESFGNEKWETEQYWTNDEVTFVMWLESPRRSRRIEYVDYQGDPDGCYTEINFWSRNRLILVFRQFVNKNKIENNVFMPPFEADFGQTEWGVGTRYGPDGQMDPVRNVKGLPRKIDMDATVKAFIEQVIAGKFGRPRLIRPGK